VSTGAVLSQVRHRRHQSQLGREGSLQIVVVHASGPPPQYTPLSDTWTQMRGNACLWGVVLSQVRHRRHESQFSWQRACQSLIIKIPVTTVPAPTTTSTTSLCTNHQLSRHSRFAPALRGNVVTTFASSKTLQGEREGDAQGGARRRAGETCQVRELVLHPARTGGVEVGAGD
jgi:hypothetical protein